MTKPSQNLRPHKPDNMQPSSVLFPKNRNSNLELLRIVCMLFIICHHWIVFILDNCGYHVPLGDTKQDYTSVFLNSFFIIGVKLLCSDLRIFRDKTFMEADQKNRRSLPLLRGPVLFYLPGDSSVQFRRVQLSDPVGKNVPG